MVWARLLAVCLGLMWPAAGPAQGLAGPLDTGTSRSPVLVIEFDRVFAESAFGQRVSAEIEAEGNAIAAENRRIEAELTEEERQLTEQRPQMAPDAFRELADAFDEKVQALRQAQDAKARALGQRSEEMQRRFLAAAQPALEMLMREAGAQVILERRTVFLSRDTIDVTEEAIARIDAAIGDGRAMDQP